MKLKLMFDGQLHYPMGNCPSACVLAAIKHHEWKTGNLYSGPVEVIGFADLGAKCPADPHGRA